MCRTKATKALAKRFRTPADTEKHYLALIAPQSQVQLHDMSSGVPLLAPPPEQMTTAEITSYCHQALVPLQVEAHSKILSELFSIYLGENSEIQSVPCDFLSDPSSGLTYPALTGARKQSVVDAERLFNPDLTAFMRQKGYKYETRYTEIIWNWRRSCDECGLSEL